MTTPASSQPNCAARLILTTCAEQAQAEQLARGLLEAELVACLNLIPGLQSWYRWQGKICHDSELQLIIKTKPENVSSVLSWLKSHHPYETPELLVLAPESGGQDYLDWIQQVC